MLFRIELLTTEKHLARVLTALDGLCSNLVVQPVKVEKLPTHEPKTKSKQKRGPYHRNNGETGTAVSLTAIKTYLVNHPGVQILQLADLREYCLKEKGITYPTFYRGLLFMVTGGLLTKTARGKYLVHHDKLQQNTEAY